jgi:MoaA/NifB/PqqE/SkfB family radical SAM enzyme
MRHTLDAFKKLGVKAVGFTGGESLLRTDIFDLLSYAKSLGFLANLNSNALLFNDRNIAALIACDIDGLNVSFDDYHLKNEKAKDLFATNIKKIRSARDAARSNMRIKCVQVIDITKPETILDLAQTARRIGADCIEIMLEQNFARTPKLSNAERQEKKVAFSQIRKTLKEAKNLIPVENSSRFLKLTEYFFLNGRLPIPCASSYATFGCDPFGRTFACASRLSRGLYFSASPDENPAKTWYSKAYSEYRHSIKDCRACSLNCQQELNLLFSPWWL